MRAPQATLRLTTAPWLLQFRAVLRSALARVQGEIQALVDLGHR